jgi:hypothetical protein
VIAEAIGTEESLSDHPRLVRRLYAAFAAEKVPDTF